MNGAGGPVLAHRTRLPMERRRPGVLVSELRPGPVSEYWTQMFGSVSAAATIGNEIFVYNKIIEGRKGVVHGPGRVGRNGLI
jgi:hypothetical protein